MDLDAFLASKAGEWNEQAARAKQPREFTKIPDCTAMFQLSTVSIEPSKSTQQPQVVWVWVMGPDEEKGGEQKYDFDGLMRDDAFYWLAQKLAKFGVDPESFDVRNLPSVLSNLEKAHPWAKLQLRTKGDWQNVNVKEVYDANGDVVAPGGNGELADTVEAHNDRVQQQAVDARAKAGQTVSAPSGNPLDDADGEAELTAGMLVEFVYKGKTLVGSVVEIDDDLGVAKMRVDGYDDLVPCKISGLSMADTEVDHASDLTPEPH